MWEDDIPEIEALLAALIAARAPARRDQLERPIVAGPPTPVGTRAWVVDCETTGFMDYDRVVSFAAVETINGRATGRYLYLVFNPGRKSHPKAAEVHGWPDVVLARQAPFSDSASDVRAILMDADEIVGHNIDFDMRFIRREILKAGLEDVAPKMYCTMLAYRDEYPNRKAKLDLCLRDIGAKRRQKTHSALEDAFLAAALYSWLKFRDGEYIAPVEWPQPTNLRD